MNVSPGIHGVANTSHLASVDRRQCRDLPSTGRLRVTLDAYPVCVGRARRIASAFMQEWAVPTPLAGDAKLVVSELVSNAVLHSGTDEVTLTLELHAGRLRIDVHDGVPNHRPGCRTPSADEENGRGLLLVQAIANERRGEWSVSNDGATTWCELGLVAS